MTTRDKEAPAKPTFSQDSGKAGPNQDGNAAYVHDSTDLATIAAELTRIADELIRIGDELHRLNWSLTPKGPRYITRHDDANNVGPLAQSQRSGGCR